jgi:F-type H+-transporting ATPase subunit delta
MGSATREALSAARAELSALGTVTLATAEDLFSAGRIIGGSLPLLTLLSETNGGTGAQDGADATDKKAAVRAVFGPKFGEQTIRLLEVVVDHRWSSQDDLLAGIEELGLRAAAESAGKDVSIEAELFAFATAVTSDPNLELAVGSKLGNDDAKVVLVTRLLENKVSAQTLTIVRQLVQQPRGRRIGELLRTAANIVADQSGLAVAHLAHGIEEMGRHRGAGPKCCHGLLVGRVRMAETDHDTSTNQPRDGLGCHSLRR